MLRLLGVPIIPRRARHYLVLAIVLIVLGGFVELLAGATRSDASALIGEILLGAGAVGAFGAIYVAAKGPDG